MDYPPEFLVLKVRESQKYLNRALTVDDDPYARRRDDINSNRIKLFKTFMKSDELLDGPFYNYARCGTWSYLTNYILQNYENAVHTRNQESRNAHIVPASIKDEKLESDSDEEPMDNPYELLAHDATLVRHRPSGDARFSRPLATCHIYNSGSVPSFKWIEDP